MWRDNKTNLEKASYLAKNILWNKPTIKASLDDVQKKLKVKIKLQSL